jgi:DNA-directed RNA polymerase beta' subunit
MSGDEMNMHVPQDPESESELYNLAAVPHQIISPANNAAIIGIYQDSMLGSYIFTRKNVKFSPKVAMNLLMMYDFVNTTELLKNVDENKQISNFDIISQILPPLTLKVKNKQYSPDVGGYDTENNNIVEIVNGKYFRGQMDKGILGSGTKGLIHRICNDFGNMAASNFIDNWQNIITEYMKISSFSVGISDLITDADTNEKIAKIIIEKKQEVKNLIDQVKLGVFQNNSGKTNEEEFETQVNNYLKKTENETQKLALNNLTTENRFVVMFNAGSKGNEINIQQMTACLGQQNVDGKRIPYGFENRTLPHFTKFDDSAAARGYVESSYINGLSPHEVFFHAMGGRIGLIDTAVKTSTTGYIQRRLIKALEDLMVHYDMTIRSNKNKIVQFSYGDDSIDTVKVENQDLPLIDMSIQDIYSHFVYIQDTRTKNIYTATAKSKAFDRLGEVNTKAEQYVKMMIEKRKDIVKNIFQNKSERTVRSPVAFAYIIQNVSGNLCINKNSTVDINLFDAWTLIEKGFNDLMAIKLAPPTDLFKVLYYYYLSPKDLVMNKRFNRRAIMVLLERIKLAYKRSIVAPGEMVGMIAAQSIGEPTTQMCILRHEHIRCGKINKITKKISMVSEKIGDFIDRIIDENPELTFGTGHENSVETLLETLENEYVIIGVDEYENVHWNKISHVSRHPPNGDLMKITTKSGRSVTTTLSHSHLTRDENSQKVQPIKGSELKEGMRIPVSKFIPSTLPEISEINIGETQIELNELFGWYIGAYLAEGNINGNTICITNVAQYYIDNVIKIGQLFGKEASIKRRNGEYGPQVHININHKELAKFLLETCGTGSFVKKVPDVAFIAPLTFKKGLLQGYMDGDGNFQCDEKHHQIRCCSRSKRLTEDLGLLFNYFGIFANIRTNFIRGSDMHNLSISAKYSKIYHDEIGTELHKRSLQNLVQYIERNATNLPDEVDKISGLGNIIAKCGKIMKLPNQSGTYKRWTKKESIGRRTLQKYIEEFEAYDKKYIIEEELSILKQAAYSDVIWDEIVNIEILPGEEEYVYDFTVPGNQTFMLNNGVIVHNTLNTFHYAGVASKSNVTRGVPRIEEILSISSAMKNPSLTIYLKDEVQTDKEKVNAVQYMIEFTKLEDIVKNVSICFDPESSRKKLIPLQDTILLDEFYAFEHMVNEALNEEDAAEYDEIGDPNVKSKFILRMEMDAETMLEKNITMDDVHFALNNSHKEMISCIYSDYNSDKLIFRIRLLKFAQKGKKDAAKSLDIYDAITNLKNFQEDILKNIVLRGVRNIEKVIVRKVKDNLVEKGGAFTKQDIWVLDTIGTNLQDVLGLDYIDAKRTISNDIVEIYNVLGIEAARQAIYNELSEVLEFDGAYVNAHHMALLCDRMTYTNKLISIFRHGINNDDIGPIAKASFEETPEMFLKAARHAELDIMRGISANVMCGQEGMFGTSAFQVILDMEKMLQIPSEEQVEKDEFEHLEGEEYIAAYENKHFKVKEDDDDECSIKNIEIKTNLEHIITQQKDNTMRITIEENNYDIFNM